MSDIDLFAGTARYYARFRPDYPPALYRAVIEAFDLDGKGRLLDVGCGTGRVAMALRDRFECVVGIDISAEMIAEAKRQAGIAGATNVRWHTMAAEAISAGLGTFRLIACGDALHWMDRSRVLALCHDRVEPGGGIALLAAGTPPGAGRAGAPWERAVARVVRRWLGERRRAGGGYFEHDERRFEDDLTDSLFVDVERGTVLARYEWDVDHVIGQLYSTSYANRRLLGDDVEAFEADVRSSLLAVEPSGTFEQAAAVQYIVARRR